MTAQTADVNTEFDAQRAGQLAAITQMRADLVTRQAEFDSGEAQAKLDADIAARVEAGTIADMGNGTYRVLVGWDRGEIFNMRLATRPGELSIVEPQAGLDLDEAGRALGYFAQPEWHGLGTVIPGGTTDIDTILAVSGGDYEVTKRISRAFDSEGNLLESPDGFQTVREGGGRPSAILGQVGTRWTAVQNSQAFAFLADLLGTGKLIPVSAFPLRGGKSYVIACRLPEDVIIDAGGIADAVVPYLMVRNSFDGKTPIQAVVTPWRPRCSNTERLALANAITRWSTPHLANALKRIDEARTTLKLSVNYYAEFAHEETKLAQTELTQAKVDAIIAEMDAVLWPDKTERETEGRGEQSKRAATTRRQRDEAIRDILGVETGRVGLTAYAVERAYTDYLDHVAPHRIAGQSMGAAMATAMVEGPEDDRKAKLHERLMLTVR
jgi:phage/plasmid-like protein (TIGR03299 family)